MGSVIGYQEAHGPVATFETDVAGKIKNLVVDINPVQSGTGNPSPDNIRPISGWTGANVTRTGKNLLPPQMAQGTSSIVVLGQDDAASFGLSLKAGTYTVSVQSSKAFAFYYRAKNGTENVHIGGYNVTSATFTLTGDLTLRLYAYLGVGLSVSDISEPQLELGSTATDYEPYQGDTYDIAFPSAAGTVYGGTLDVVKGELVVDKILNTNLQARTWEVETTENGYIFSCNAFTGTYAKALDYNFICNKYKNAGTYRSNLKNGEIGCYNKTNGRNRFSICDNAYDNVDDFKVSLSDCVVCYDLATPITYQLTPQEVRTTVGTNTIYADTGDTSVIYPKTITPIETVSNVNLMELRRSIMMAMQHNYIPDITTYGVEWHYSDPSTVLTRTGNAASFSNPIPAESLSSTGSSPFDNIYPWSEMKRYNIINGEVAYSQDDAGYSETDYDTVVYIPTFYYKAEKDTTNQKWNWSISGKQLEGYKQHPGSGRYVGRFHTSGSSSGVFSKGGVTPLASTTRANFRTYSHNKGSNWWQIDLATWSAIQMLYIIEFANWNSQNMLGNGQNTSSKNNTGDTTGASYHTVKRTGDSNSYRWIENLFGKLNTWVDGYVGVYRKAYFTTNVNAYSDSQSDMTNSNILVPNNETWIAGFGYYSNCDWAFIPDTVISSGSSKYVTDAVYTDQASQCTLCVAGDYSTHVGLFCFNASHAVRDVNSSITSRLIYIPTT